VVPTLAGRIQTRIFVLAVIGSLLTLIVTPLLPLPTPVGRAYAITFSILAAVLIFGIAWEFIYHALQQFRWEKDWPTLFGLLTAVNEGVLIWLVAKYQLVPGLPEVSLVAFVIDFAIVWVGTWAFVNGPMRVPFLHWRFRGGRLV